MTERDSKFKEMASAARALADVCDSQKDTVAWWTDFGVRLQTLMTLAQANKPTRENHSEAVYRGMHGVRES